MLRDTLLGQLDIAWQLTSYHLSELTTAECLWRPAARGLHVVRDGDTWRAEWPDTESYTLGPPSIAWLTWHMTFWWRMVIDHSFGPAQLAREQVTWPGTAEAVCAQIHELHATWRSAISNLSDEDLRSSTRARWPIADKPFADIVAWATVELMKNGSEIGYARFLHAVR